MSTISTPNPAADLLARTRGRLLATGAKNLKPAAFESLVQARTREKVVAAAPIGKAAARVDAAVGDLIEALREYLAAYPHDADAEAAIRTALVSAGLDPSPDDFMEFGHRPDEFNGIADELRTWLPLIEIMNERLEPLWASETNGEDDEEAEADGGGKEGGP